MGERQLVSVIDSSSIGIRDVPQGAGHVLLPVVEAVVVDVARILYPRRIGLSRIDHAVAVHILLTVVELVAIGVVVPGICG